ncbi:MAG: S-layer homology domain-containing protein [bacterium]|nr:S-layer homology domain-containing protein [bacterium]
MKRKTCALLSASIVVLFLVESALAQSCESGVSYLLPPRSALIVDGRSIENETERGLRVLQKSDTEVVHVPKSVSGAQLLSHQFRVNVSPDSVVEVGSVMTLKAGSIHFASTADPSAPMTLRLANQMELSFQSAQFLAFAGGDGSQYAVKVLEGEVVVKNIPFNQSATVSTLTATHTDSSGRLLIPYVYRVPDQPWWLSQDYRYGFDPLPLAHAGGDQRVLGNLPVMLDGEKSNFKTGDIFEWTLIKGPRDRSGKEVKEVAFDTTNIVKPLFTPAVEGEYHFTLQVTSESGEKSNCDSVAVYAGKHYLLPIEVFPDVPVEHLNNVAITYLYQKGAMRGSQNPETGEIVFRPQQTINRVEILKSVFENLRKSIPRKDQLSALEVPLFLDVEFDHWFAPYVYLAKKEGIVAGNEGFYRPADEVTLVEALKIITKAGQISFDAFQNTSGVPYSDAEEGAWYVPYLFFARKYNLIDPDVHGKIRPDQPLSRAQFAEILYRMDSINVLEKRGLLVGVLRRLPARAGLSNAEIYIYKAVDDGDGQVGTDDLLKKGDLFLRTSTRDDGRFEASLPIHTKFYVEALFGDDASVNRVIVETDEGQETSVELEIQPD